MGRRGDRTTGNGTPGRFHVCSYDGSHVFTSLSARFEHEPSCPANPDRVPEWENPERLGDE